MRSHYAGQVNDGLTGQEVTVAGWVHRRRDHGGVIFVDLRDREGLLQIVFIWGIYATSVIQVLATPVLAITLLLLTMEKALGIAVFDPAIGGDPVLFQHFFWFYSHPAVYIMILPGMAIVNELIGTFSRRKIFGYMFVAMSSVALALQRLLTVLHNL